MIFCSCCNWTTLLQKGEKTKFSYYRLLKDTQIREESHMINEALEKELSKENV